MTTKTIHALFWPVLIFGLTACVEMQPPQPLNATELGQTAQTAMRAEEELKKLSGAVGDNCNSQPDAKKSQFVIGYGSLMQDESRKRSAPNAGSAYPVKVDGFRRGWFAKGGGVGLDATYLGAVPDKNAHLNGVIYKIKAEDIPVMDKREYFYCRLPVSKESFQLLNKGAPTPRGEIWIYVNKPDSIATATAKFPIVQSYVDIFVSGCQEQEQRYALTDFAKECLSATGNWSSEWVNDRIYPRRPFIYQPKAVEIDRLLKQQLPDYFQKIHIESKE